MNPLKVWGRVWWIALLGSVSLPSMPGAALGAQDPFAECEALFAKAPSERDSSRCFREKGRDPELREEAIRRLDRLFGRYPEEPWVPFYLATLEWTEPTERTPNLYAHAAQGFAARGEIEHEFLARRGRSGILIKLGLLEEAQDELDRMIPLAERLEGPEGVIRVRIQKAGLLRLRGRLEEAAEALEADRELALGPEAASLNARLRGDWLHEMGIVQFNLGQHREARRLYKQGLEIVPPEDKSYHAAIWALLGGVDLSSRFPSAGVRERAAEEYEKALALATESGSLQTRAEAHWGLGKLKPAGESVEHLERCAELAETPAMTGLCLSALAAAVVDIDPGRARRLIDRALGAASTSEDAWTEIYVRREKMRVDWATRPRPEAIQEALDTLELVESTVIEPIDSATERARLRSDWFDLGYWLVGMILTTQKSREDLEREDLETAFDVVETMRARTLRESLSLADIGSGDPDASVRWHESVRLQEVEEALTEDEALVVFQMGLDESVAGEFEGGAWALVVTCSGTRVYRLSEPTAVEQDIQLLSGLDHIEQVGSTMLVRLHRRLLQPVLEDLPKGIDRLTLVADGALHALPFAALRADESVESSLATRFELTQAPSATFWVGWKKRGDVQPPAKPALVLADPDLGSLPDEPVQTSSERGIELGRLPFARREGKAVARRLGGRLVMDAEASEHALKTEPALADYGVLHLAVHAIADPEHPERSTVFLAPGDGEDGRLTPTEIAELDLQDRLVVLAGCETATGELLRGEGALSLARYFFQAGARTVVASLKNLPDETAAAFFESFYGHLAEGLSVVEALSLAQRAQLEAGGPARVWAGVQVYGDGDLVLFPDGLPEPVELTAWRIVRSFGLPGLVVLVVLGLILAIRRRAVTSPSP